MKVIYDRETDTLSIILRKGKVAESDEPRPGLILDYDKAGRVLSIEMLDASEQVNQPGSVEFALASACHPARRQRRAGSPLAGWGDGGIGGAARFGEGMKETAAGWPPRRPAWLAGFGPAWRRGVDHAIDLV